MITERSFLFYAAYNKLITKPVTSIENFFCSLLFGMHIAKGGYFMYYYTISQNELTYYLQKRDTTLIDLRTPEAFQRGHIPGAINIPYPQLHTKSHSAFGRDIVILYCDRGSQSLLAARDLQKRGITAFSIYGGFLTYHGPVESLRKQANG